MVERRLYFCGATFCLDIHTFCVCVLMPFCQHILKDLGFPGASVVKIPPASAGDMGSIPQSERSPGEGNGNPLQYSHLENPMDEGAGRLQSMGSQELDMTKQLNNN